MGFNIAAYSVPQVSLQDERASFLLTALQRNQSLMIMLS